MSRQPLLLGTIGAVVGIVLAIIIFGGGGGGPVVATAGPSAPGASTAPTTVAVASPSTTVDGSLPPVTAAPSTVLPTSAPTTAPSVAAPSPTPNTNPRIVSFDVPNQEDCTGSTGGLIHVSWSVRRASGASISIAGGGVYKTYAGLTGEDDLPFPCSDSQLEQTYTLTTVGGTGPAATVTKTVRTRPPSIEAFALTTVTDCPGDNLGSATLRLSYAVRAATGAVLYWKDASDSNATYAVYSTYNGKEAGPIPISYFCQYDSIAFRLETSGGFGDPDTQRITVQRPTAP